MRRKILLGLLMGLFLTSKCFGAWDAARPTDDELKKDVPAVVRANWNAITTGTDPALQITNAKVAAGAAIVDTKFAQITTLNKVSGTALTSLNLIPTGAGAIPAKNGGLGLDTASLSGIPKVSTGTWTINANLDDLGNGTTYKRYNPANVGITGGNISGITDLGVADGGLGRSSFTKYAVPYASNTTTIGEVPIGTAYQYLRVNSAATGYEFADPSNRYTIASPGTGTFTAPANTTMVYVTLIGGGGGGGSGGDNEGGGGGGGETILRYAYPVTPGNTYNYSVGGGGAGGVPQNPGTDGVDTIFGTGIIITASKGTGGADHNTGGAGGAANTINGSGQAAGSSYSIAGGRGGNGLEADYGGGGGGSLYSSGGAGGAVNTNGTNAAGYGSGGGGGGGGQNKNGGNGTGGVISIDW